MKVGDLVKYYDWSDQQILGMVYKIYECPEHSRPGKRAWRDLIHMRAFSGETYSDTSDCFQVIQSFISNKSSDT